MSPSTDATPQTSQTFSDLHGCPPLPERAADWRIDALWDVLHLRTRAAARRIVRDGASYAEQLDELLGGPASEILDADPGLWDHLAAFEDEVAEGLADAAATVEREDAAAHPPPPGPRRLLHHVDLPGHTFTGLPPYHPPIEEPRAAALLRQTATIRLTVADAARIGAARGELHRLREAELRYLPDLDAAGKAALTRRLHRQVAAAHGFGQRIPAAPRVLVSGTQGTGKTAEALAAVAAVRERIAVRWTEPSLAKAEEAAVDYRAAAGPDSLPAIVVRGRSAPDPTRPEARMCQRHEAADRVSRRGLSVRQAMCGGCPFARSGCGHLEQAARIAAMDGAGVFFGATEGLFAHSPAPAAELLIGDERIDPAEVQTVSLDALQPALLPFAGGPVLAEIMAAHRTIEATRDALARPRQLEALRAAGVGRAELRAVIRRLEPLAAPDPACIADAGTDAEIIKRLDALKPAPAAAALSVLRAVLREIDQPRPALNGLALRDGLLTVARLRKPRGIAGAGVLLLDGTGDAGLNRATFGARLRQVECRIERDAHVTGTAGRGYSRQSITALDAFDRPMPNKEAAARRLRQEVAAIAAAQPGPCLVAAPLAVERCLAAEHLEPGAPVAHFGALRGRNAWQDCPSAVILGQNALSVRDVEDLARAWLALDPAPFHSADLPMPADWPVQGWPYRCTRMRRLRDGSVSPVEVAIHPDPRVQAVLEQVREAEVVQAADRVRPVFNRRRLVLMNSLVLDVTYDRVMTHKELVAGGTRWERAMAATGIVPLNATELHAMHPGIFPSKAVAADWLKRPGLRGGISQIELHLRFAPPCRYRPKGRSGTPSRVLIDPERHPDPRAALEAVAGPLALFHELAGVPARGAAPSDKGGYGNAPEVPAQHSPSADAAPALPAAGDCPAGSNQPSPVPAAARSMLACAGPPEPGGGGNYPGAAACRPHLRKTFALANWDDGTPAHSSC